jgi:hypothetical protein
LPIGPEGPAGPPGPAAPEGAEGPPGKIASITCELVTGKGPPRIVCTVAAARALSLQDRLVRLVRGGRTVASGRSGRLHADRQLPKGKYTLVVGRGAHVKRIQAVIRELPDEL